MLLDKNNFPYYYNLDHLAFKTNDGLVRYGKYGIGETNDRKFIDINNGNEYDINQVTDWWYDVNVPYDTIDEEVLDIVENFTKAGYQTLFSCQGHAHQDHTGGGTSIPYLTIKLPEDGCYTSFIVNNITNTMEISIRAQIFDNDVDDLGNSDYDKYVERYNGTDKDGDYILTIYLSGVWLSYDENDTLMDDVFEKIRKIFIEDLLRLSKYLVNVCEVYRKTC